MYGQVLASPFDSRPKVVSSDAWKYEILRDPTLNNEQKKQLIVIFSEAQNPDKIQVAAETKSNFKDFNARVLSLYSSPAAQQAIIVSGAATFRRLGDIGIDASQLISEGRTTAAMTKVIGSSTLFSAGFGASIAVVANAAIRAHYKHMSFGTALADVMVEQGSFGLLPNLTDSKKTVSAALENLGNSDSLEGSYLATHTASALNSNQMELTAKRRQAAQSAMAAQGIYDTTPANVGTR